MTKIVACPACGEETAAPVCGSCGAELANEAMLDSLPKRAGRERDRTANDQDQTASDQDQTWSDHDQTASDRDHRSADEDQHAADDDLAAGGDAPAYYGALGRASGRRETGTSCRRCATRRPPNGDKRRGS